MNSYIPNTDVPIYTPEELEKPDEYRVRSGPAEGVLVTLKAIQPLLLNKVMRSVKMPKRPTYETLTITGAVQIHPMDEAAAKDTPGGEAEWSYYKEMTTEAQSEQNERITTAIFAMGSNFDWNDVPRDSHGNVTDWEMQHRLLGVEVPQEPQLKKAHYLATSLGTEEITAITGKIMRLSGVDETAVQEAEENFRGDVRDRPRQAGELADADANPQGNAQRQLAVQPAF